MADAEGSLQCKQKQVSATNNVLASPLIVVNNNVGHCEDLIRAGIVTNGVSKTSSRTHAKSTAKEQQQEQVDLTARRVILFLGCVLYLVFYGVVAYIVFVTYRSQVRHARLHGDMRAIIDALRFEPDREKRVSLQRKILDAMVNMYLDRPSADE